MSDEKLIGDVTSDMLRAIRADRVSKAYSRITGRKCNCGQRKAKLNELHRKLREIKTRREQNNTSK